MCGIVGLFAFNKNELPFRSLWADLVNHLHHRGPDEGAWWSDKRYFFGHRRLSIIDLSTGSQPMATEDGRLVITYNGEIYNYIELRVELQKMGFTFRTTSDTEVLLYGYRAWGMKLPQKLIGQFAFGIADRNKDQLFLARDRFGEKPLFVRQTPGYLAFASELRPLTAFPDLQREMDIDALGGYLSLNYVPGNATLVKSIRRLGAGTWMLAGADGSVFTDQYWSLPPLPQPVVKKQSIDEAVAEFHNHLDDAVRICLRSDVPVGIFLSGGIDSSLVAEAAMRLGNLSNAYCIDFEQQSYSEFGAAKLVADRLGLPIERALLTPHALGEFFDFVEHADDPLADSSSVAVWTIARTAARKNKVVLGGDGGDELFGGYLTYRASLLYAASVARLPVGLRHWIAAWGTHLPTSEGKVTFSYKLRRFLRGLDLPPFQAHFTWNGTWLPSEAALLMSSDETCQKVRQALPSLVERLSLRRPDLYQFQRADIAEYLANDILSKVDRMSMAHGLEVRAPYLVHGLAEWAVQLPEWQKVNRLSGRLKVVPREASRRLFGDKIANRPKNGFSIPIHSWMRADFAERVRDLLAPDSVVSLGVLDPQAISKVVTDHFSGKKSYGFEIWGLAVLVAWYRARLAAPPVPPKKYPLFQREI